MRKSILAAAVLAMCSIVAAQQTMNNDAVIKLVKAGLSDDLIVTTISASPGKYDTSADALIALRSAGADSKVISAVLMKSAPGPPPPPAVPASALAAPANAAAPVSKIPAGVDSVGIYYQARDGRWQKVMIETVTRKTGGVLKSVATEGKIKGNVNGSVKGSSSGLTLTLPATFLLYVPEGTIPGEYLLMRFHAHEKDREFRTETGGLLHRAGDEAKDSVDFDSKQLAPRAYQVTLGSELGNGEYGFLAPNDASDLGSNAGSGKMYTFSVEE
jgi:hypothetical protein